MYVATLNDACRALASLGHVESVPAGPKLRGQMLESHMQNLQASI
jgi:hypothetical protein